LQESHLKDNSSSQNHKNLLAPIEKRVYSCVRLESRHVDDICFEADVTVSEAASALFELERKKLVKQLVRNFYVRV
jgi:DNA processing protein